MFVQLKKSYCAVNIRNFDSITIKSISGKDYVISVGKSFETLNEGPISSEIHLATFPKLEEAEKAFISIMKAIADGVRHWNYWQLYK